MGEINFPVDMRIQTLDAESDLAGYYVMLAKQSVNPAAILANDLADKISSLIGGAQIGEIRLWSLPEPPALWQECNGLAISRGSQYGALLVSAGCPFGTGDGSTTVNIPNFSGRLAVHTGTVPGGGPSLALGDAGGAGKVSLAVAELPQHNFEYTWPGCSNTSVGATPGNGAFTNDLPPSGGHYTPYVGSGQAHENMPPYLCVRYIVYLGEEL